MSLTKPIVALMLGMLATVLTWGIIIDFNTEYPMDVNETYSDSFSRIETQMNSTVKYSEGIRTQLGNETKWSITDTAFFTGSMVSMVLSFLFNVIPIMFSTFSLFFEMLNLPGEVAWIFAIVLGIVTIVVAIKVVSWLFGREA